jgi:uncharacterized membrane protein
MERIGIIIVASVALINLGLIALVKTLKGDKSDKDSLSILKQRLARGEINEDEYRHLRDVLAEKP